MEAKLKIIKDRDGCNQYLLKIYDNEGNLVYKDTSYLFQMVEDMAWEIAGICLDYIEL